MYPRRQRWTRGTYMKLKDKDILRTFVITQDDIDLYRKGVPINPRKIPQRELSRRIGCSESLIGHLTSGRNRTCKAETAVRIAEVLNIDVRVLFDPETPSTVRHSNNRQSSRSMERMAA